MLAHRTPEGNMRCVMPPLADSLHKPGDPLWHDPNPPTCCAGEGNDPLPMIDLNDTDVVWEFDRTVDKIPHLVNNWRQHRMRGEWQALRQFIKDWNGLPGKREQMLSAPLEGDPADPKLAYIAAVVHSLCLRDNWEVPDWVDGFVSETLFTGRFSPEEWKSGERSVARLRRRLNPVGEKHNVVLFRESICV